MKTDAHLRSSRSTSVYAAVLALALAAGGCLGAEKQPSLDSESHFLVACADDSECSSLQCLCGFCSAPCDSADSTDGDSCDHCVAASEIGPRCVVASDLCAVGCAADEACGDGFSCGADGFCVAAAAPGPTPLEACTRPSGALASQPEVVLSARSGCAGSPPLQLFDDAAAWATFLADSADCLGNPAAQAVDFTSARVLVLTYSSFNTCGLTLDGVVGYAGADAVGVEATFTDSSRGCEVQCTAIGGYVVAVRVPKSGAVEGCRLVYSACD